jgi:hypothetical protein
MTTPTSSGVDSVVPTPFTVTLATTACTVTVKAVMIPMIAITPMPKLCMVAPAMTIYMAVMGTIPSMEAPALIPSPGAMGSIPSSSVQTMAQA